jgi:hypothetical protein
MLRKSVAVLTFILVISSIVTIAGTTSYGAENKYSKVNYFDSAIQQESESANSIMRPDHDTLNEWISLHNQAPRAFIDPNIILAEGQSFSLINHLQYTPSQRDQGWCGNCWVWGGTGVLEIALHVQTGIKDRLFIQYFDSNYDDTGVTSYSWACCGGWLDYFSQFYSSNGKAIPWSNTNAGYADYARGCGSSTITASSISISPNYPITSCTAQTIPNTHGVAKSTAITNIKNILHQNKAVWFAWYLPTSADWNVFFALGPSENLALTSIDRMVRPSGIHETM